MISIIITCYNYGAYLGQCISSILHQSYQTYDGEIEVIVVDDHSDDPGTLEQLKAMSEHCRVIYLSKRQGLAHAANIGIAQATGPYVMRLDADDWLGCEHIELLMRPLLEAQDNKRDVECVYSDYWPVEDGKVKTVKYQKDIPLGSCMIYSKKLWEKTGGYNEDMYYHEDIEFWKRLIQYTTPVHLAIPTWYYRQHEKQMSRAHNARHKVREELLKHTKVLTVIPARGNSKEVISKNLQKVGGYTLVERAIRMVKDSNITTQIVVSSEDEEIRQIAESAGVSCAIHRPDFLSDDNTSTIPVTIHAVSYMSVGSLKDSIVDPWKPDIVITVQPTCPFTPPEALKQGLEMLLGNDQLDSVVCVSKVRKHPWRTYWLIDDILEPIFDDERQNTLQRQDRDPAYGITGGFYIRRRRLLDNWPGNNFALGKCAGVEVSQSQGLDIDTATDLLIAQKLGELEEKSYVPDC